MKRYVTLLGLFAPWGTAHVYLGRTRRGFAWLLAPTACLLILSALGPTLGRGMGGRSFVALGTVIVLGTWIASVRDAHRIAETTTATAPRGTVAAYWIGAFVFAVVVRALNAALILQPLNLGSGVAMAPAYMNGDRVFVDKRAFLHALPSRGEAVVFRIGDSGNSVGRVVAQAGDRVRLHDGHLSINDWPLPHCVVGEARQLNRQGNLEVEFLDGRAFVIFLAADAPPLDEGPYLVAPGEWFILGDNRHSAYDSRKLDGGGVRVNDLVARPLFFAMSERGSRDADDLVLPPGAEALAPALAKCLATKPPLEQTRPPP